MGDYKENHRVHFDKEEELEEKNEIVVEKKDGKFDVNLGFLQFKHRYKINLEIPRKLCGSTTLSQAKLGAVDLNSCFKITLVSATDDIVHFQVDLFAHKENLMAEEFTFHLLDVEDPLTVVLKARVLGKGKGTPLLKNGIHLIHESGEGEVDSGASSD